MENLQQKDIPFVCRICLKKKNNLINIFQPTFKDFEKVLYVFQEIFSEKIINNDGLPPQICSDCIIRLKDVHEFVTLYHKSKKVLKDILKEKHEEKIIKEQEFNEIIFENDCRFCGYNYRLDPGTKNNRKFLKTHILEEHLIDIRISDCYYRCIKCEMDFSMFNAIINHFLSDKHQDKTCFNCKSKFNTIKDCFNHRNNCKRKNKLSSSENEDYKCLHCSNMEINGFEQVLEHFKTKHEKDRICMICEKSVNLHMELHLHKHRPLRMKFLCLRCLKYFETNAQLTEHRKNVDHSTKKCDICGMVVNARKFSEHKAYHKDITCICELCGMSFNGKNSYFRHYKVKHLGHRYYCDQCPQNYSTYNDLVRHINKIHPEMKISKRTQKPKTNQFSLRSISQSLEKNPIKNKLNNKEESYEACRICNKKILRSHKREIHLHKMWHQFGHTVSCLDNDCRMTFLNKGILFEHMNSVHEKYVCETCNKEFFNKTYYQSHCLVHTWHLIGKDLNLTPDCTICRICKKNCGDLKNLSIHALKEHTLYLCSNENCGMIYSCIQTLQKHKADVHKKENLKQSSQLFICKICNENCRTARKFSAHQERHNQSRKFKCEVCSLMFNTGGQLKVHSRTHTGERPYACRFCSKTFAYSHGKKLHERIHTGEKPYSCPYCDQRFSDSSHRRQHVFQHEKKNKDLQLTQILSN